MKMENQQSKNVINFNEIARLEAELDDFLTKNPKYKQYQEQLDAELDKATTAEGRMFILKNIILAKQKELDNRLKELYNLVNLVDNIKGGS